MQITTEHLKHAALTYIHIGAYRLAGTHLERGLEDDHVAGTLNPRLAVHLHRHVGVQMYFDVATLLARWQRVS